MPPLVQIQNYNLYAQGIMNSELCTLDRTKHNQIRVKDYIIMIKWQKSKNF